MDKNLTQLEQKALLAQMNPHFIFNALNTIHGFYLGGDSKNGSKYLITFASLLRKILESSSKEFISLEKERELMTQYANLFNLKLEHTFDFIFEIDKNIEPLETFIPSMIIQPFIENALLHGIINHKIQGIVKVQIQLCSDNSIQVIISDNGIGREAALKNKVQSEYESVGLEITKKRIKYLNKLENIPPEITFFDLKNNDESAAGTRVEFKLFCKLA